MLCCTTSLLPYIIGRLTRTHEAEVEAHTKKHAGTVHAWMLSSVPALHCKAPPCAAVLLLSVVPVMASSAPAQLCVPIAPPSCTAEFACGHGPCERSQRCAERKVSSAGWMLAQSCFII